jgi:hypothetical protein
MMFPSGAEIRLRGFDTKPSLSFIPSALAIPLATSTPIFTLPRSIELM